VPEVTQPLQSFFVAVRKHNVESFAKRFPEPMLLYLATITGGSAGVTTHRMSVEEAAQKRGSEAQALGRDQRVAVVRKSPRNPIASQIAIGRGDDNDIIVQEPTVSKQHAFLEQRGAIWYLSDLDSANGTFVSGRRLDANDSAPVVDDAILALGSCELRFLLPMSFHAYVLRVLSASEHS
jgi:hypothetical protein